jgi:acetyl esterase/lipase
MVKESKPSPDLELSYTSSLGRDFPIYVFKAEQPTRSGRSPAIVMFHGGSWQRGTPEQFYRHASVWNQLGVTVILPVYALGQTHGATPQHSVEDAFRAWREIHKNARLLGIDPKAIAAGGGSAGGHLAAGLATLTPPASIDDHVPPTALVLFNPAIDNSPDGFGADRLGPGWQSYSPFHNIAAGHPPTLFMLGDRDVLIPVETGQRYCEQVRPSASCQLIIYPEGAHGWFNTNGFVDTLRDSTRFIAETFSLPPLPFKDTRRVDAFMLIKDGAGDYTALTENEAYQVPADHTIGDLLFRYEGPVVEGETFGVRVYFDERARFDVFGKTGPDLALRSARNDYHAEAAWGRDTLKVGQSLGFASPAIATQSGLETPAKVDQRSVTILSSDNVARFTLTYDGWAVGGARLNATHEVAMRQGADYVEHTLSFASDVRGQLVAGLVRHGAGAVRTGQVGKISYLLTYGPQSDRDEGLGMAIIYPANDAKAPQNELSHVVPLVLDQKTRTTKYWATADWAGDPDFAPDIEAFETKVRTLAGRWKFDDKPKK